MAFESDETQALREKKIKDFMQETLKPNPDLKKHIYEKIEINSKNGVVFGVLEPASDELKTCTVKEEKVEIKKEGKREYFYILWEQNGAFRLDYFFDLESAENITKNWNEKGKKAVVITTNQLKELQLKK